MAPAEAFLIVRSGASQRRFGEFCAGAAGTAGRVLAAQPSQGQRVLEAGTRAWHCWIARYRDPEAARAAYAALDLSPLRVPAEPVVLLAPGLPADLPPELAHLPARPGASGAEAQPPTLMLIEGDVSDEEAMARYRDIIMPLLGELGGYYHVYLPGSAVEVLSGTWHRGFLALSRWPGEHAARAFWLGERYQGDAIPARAGAGSFDVVTFVGERDDQPDGGGARALVHRFLQSLWSGDKDGAKACFAPGAQWWFRPSLGYPAPMPCVDAVDIVMDDMIGRFDVDEPFEVELHFLLADGTEVTAEYTAAGTTKSGRAYRHRYALRASVGEEGIHTVRPWADTKYFLETLYGD